MISENDELSQIEILEEKLKELIDLTTQKSSNGRVTSFDGLCKAFSTKYMPDFIAGRQMTLTDSIERGLKKGKGGEQEVAAKLVVLLCLQLGSVSDCETIYKEQKNILLTLMTDHSVSAAARAQVTIVTMHCITITIITNQFLTVFSVAFRWGCAVSWPIVTWLKSAG